MKKYVRLTKVLRWFLAITFFLSSAVFLPLTGSAATGSLKVHMLSHDDGRNDSFIIELPNGEVMIVDNQNHTSLISKLNSLGITSVKYVVGTHQHSDHIGGLDGFINSGFTINNTKIYYPDGPIHRTNAEYTNLVNAATSHGKTMEYLVDNEYILNTTYDNKPLIVKAIGPLYWRVLNGGDNDYTNVNDASLILKITYGTKSILMMGDAKSLTESDLMTYRNGELNGIQVIKIGHHGIKDEDQWSASGAFLDRVNPSKILITNGTHDIAVTIANTIQQRNIPYWTTGQNGVKGPDVTLTTDGTADWSTASTPYWKPGDTGTAYYFMEHQGDTSNTNGLRRMYNDTPIGSDVATCDSQWGGYHIRWQLVAAGDGYYYIQNMKYGTRLYCKTDGSDVYMVPGTDTSDNVKWQIVDFDGTWKHIDNKASNMRLHSKSSESWLVRMTSKTWTDENVQFKLLPIPFGS